MKMICSGLFYLSLLSTLSCQKIISGEPPENSIVYYCSPCGCPHDGKYFDAPGSCPSCQMPLLARYSGIDISQESIPTPKVAILVFDNADIMDVTGPLSVFEHAGFNIVTFAKSKEKVVIGNNLPIDPDFTLENLPDVDIIVFPGGGLAENNPGDEEIKKFIGSKKEKNTVLFSVCSGAFFLGEAGILNQNESTTFASLIPVLKKNYPETSVRYDVNYIDNGKVVCSSGLSSGIDAAFQVVSKFLGSGRAQDLANHMEYPWKRNNEYSRSQLADNYITAFKSLIQIFSEKYINSFGNQNTWQYSYKLADKIDQQIVFSLLRDELNKNKSVSNCRLLNQEISFDLNHSSLGQASCKIWLDKVSKNEVYSNLSATRIISI